MFEEENNSETENINPEFANHNGSATENRRVNGNGNHYNENLDPNSDSSSEPNAHISVMQALGGQPTALAANETSESERPSPEAPSTPSVAGVAKQLGPVRFNPPLPEAYKTAIERLAVGSVNKIIFFFHNRFWPENIFMGRASESGKPGEEFLLFSSKPGSTVLTAYLVGQTANIGDQISLFTICNRAMQCLVTMFGADVPRFVRSRARVSCKFLFSIVKNQFLLLETKKI